MQVSKKTVTPKQAMEWLKRNVSNRPMSQAWVKKLAGLMTAGEFVCNGESIKFNANGDLIDGQHRLAACVMSGKSIEVYVILGLPHEAFDTIDQGKKRSMGDILARRGETNCNVLAAAVRNVYCFGHEQGYSFAYRSTPRTSQLDAILVACPEIREAVTFVVSENRKPSLLPSGACAGLVHEMRKSDRAKADVFWSRVLTGEGLSKKMAEYWLRSRLLDNLSAVAKIPQDSIVALCIKAWNMAKAGRECRNLKWDSGREDFPTIS